jgi:hypothetical protein
MLAQSTTGSSAVSIDVLIWVGALIVAVLILGIVILLVRKKLFTKDADSPTGLLNDLRRMHKSGELTTEEYDAARKALTTRIAAKMPAGKPVQSAPRASSAARPPRQSAPDGELRAKPGFDLTGAPLPSPPPQPGRYDRKPPSP